MEQYRTEEEQVEAVRRWWNEYGRTTVAAVVIALAAGFGWQTWQSNQERQSARASDLSQEMLRVIEAGDSTAPASRGIELAEQLKREFEDSTYTQFAALHLAAVAVNEGKLADAQAQLEWVLAVAPVNGDTARVARQRLARVIAAAGDAEQALTMLADAEPGPYEASYAMARGDILLSLGRGEEAREAYALAMESATAGGQGMNLPLLQQKLQSLTPVPPRTLEPVADAEPAAAAMAPAAGDADVVREE